MSAYLNRESSGLQRLRDVSSNLAVGTISYKLIPMTGIDKKVECGRDATGLYENHISE